MKTVVALPGEGIGIEVVDATCELLSGAGVPLKILTPPQITAPGSLVPDETVRMPAPLFMTFERGFATGWFFTISKTGSPS
jgi:hypothetical protein